MINISADDIYYKLGIEDFMKKIKSGNFFHGRYNDGEFNAIRTLNNPMNSNNHNCDFHQYFYGLGRDLKQSLIEYNNSDNYIISGGKNYFNENRDIFSEIYNINPNLKIQDGYIYYDFIMNPNGKYFDELIDYFNENKVVIIGASYMKDIHFLKNFNVIEVPITNCYLVIDDVISQINKLNEDNENIIYCFMSGMMSDIIIHKFSKTDKKNSYLNIGSAWDYFFQSPKYSMIRHRGIYNKLVSSLNQYYSKYIL